MPSDASSRHSTLRSKTCPLCAATHKRKARSPLVDHRDPPPGRRLTAAHHLDDPDCGIDSLNRWLRQSARVAAASGTAATYVLCRGQVVGYYSLAISAVEHRQAPARLRRGMPDPVPVVLLACLALDRSERGQSLGGHLLVDALSRSVRGGREFGARAVVVDAISDDAASFYRNVDFRDLDDRRLWRRLTCIARARTLNSTVGSR
jgi:predicted N-acetyltransferase YhbS